MAEGEATVSIVVDGVEMTVPAGELLIKAAQDQGTYIPHFCWHPRMNPVGMCRMCLVEVETPRGRMLTTSCTMPVAEGMIVDTESDVVQKAQEGVLEFLLINHPLDCPVCDKGGECPLQDQTLGYGPGESRFVEEKRHYEKPIEISDLILLDRERCILCARCTRFSDEVSGDPLIEFKDRGNQTQVLTFPNEPFVSYFSGNTVQICPVGALTAKPYRFRARPWDLEAVESVSLVDTVHSKISMESSQNQVVRITGVDNDPTNHGWLSDKDRFIYSHVHSEARLTTPLIRDGDGLREAEWAEALQRVADEVDAVPGEQVAGLGGARSSNEEAFAFGKFLRSVVGTPHLDAQLGDGLLPELAACVASRGVIDDVDRTATILVWGPDLKEELPVLYLRVRHAVSELGAKLIVVHPRRTGLDDVAAIKLTYRPGEGPDLLRKLAAGEGDLAGVRRALEDGPVVALIGRPGLGEDARLAEAVAAFSRDLPGAKLLPLLRRGNVYGALDMGVTPTLLPGRVSVTDDGGRASLLERWDSLPAGIGRDATGILEGLSSGELSTLVMLGSDPLRDHADPELARTALESASFVVALDLFLTDSSSLADVVLPVAGLAESEGTATNLEGRVQKLNRLIPPAGTARPAWSVLDDIATAMGGDLAAPSAEAVSKEIAEVAPAYRGVAWDLLSWGAGREGVVVPLGEGEQPLEYIPTDPGVPVVIDRLSLHLARELFDDGVMVRNSLGIADIARVPHAFLNQREASALAVTEGDRLRLHGIGEIELPVAIDESLADGTVYVPFNQKETAPLGATASVQVDAVRETMS